MKLYIPTYNSAPFLRTLEVDPRFDVVVVDNCSDDDSASVAEERNWTCVRRQTHGTRTENWDFAVRHFLQGDGIWAKWLFSGDHLYPHSYDLLEKGIAQYPQAKLIASEYDIVARHNTTRWQSLQETALIGPMKSMKLAATQGNWFGSPIGHAFHREALENGFTFGAWHWVADMQFFLSLSFHSPILYLKESVGQFCCDARKVYAKEQNSLSSSIEEFLIRKEAASLWLELGGDQRHYRHIEETLFADVERQILLRAFAKEKNHSSLQAIPCRKLLKELLWRPF